MIPDSLFEIVIPTHYNDQKPISAERHQTFYNYVLLYSNGITISGPMIGHWKNNIGIIQKEEVITVKFTTSNGYAEKIARYAQSLYYQNKIMYYKLSDSVHFV